jgi:hypothetical protein
MVLCINIWSDGHRFLSSITPHPSFSKICATVGSCPFCLSSENDNDYVDVAFFSVFDFLRI